MSVASPGDLVLVYFPVTNQAGGKNRPALVLADAYDGDVIIGRVTSQPSFGPADVALQDWSAEGLLLPSWVQLSKLITMEDSLILAVIGSLSARDQASVSGTFVRWVAAAWQSTP